MPGQTGPAWFVLQGQHGSVRFWPGTVQFDLQCKQGISLCEGIGIHKHFEHGQLDMQYTMRKTSPTFTTLVNWNFVVKLKYHNILLV